MRKNHSPAALGADDEIPSAGLKEAFLRQLGSFLGLFIAAAAAAAGLALASWNFADPSLNNYAAVASPTNIFGFWGASFADIFMQFFGLASLAALLPPFFWGLLLLMQKSISRFGRRLIFLILGLCAFSAACALLPAPASWPMPIGLGGVVGDRLIGLFHFIPIKLPEGLAALISLLLLFPLSVALAAYAGAVIGRGGAGGGKAAARRAKAAPAGPVEPQLFTGEAEPAGYERSANDNYAGAETDDRDEEYYAPPGRLERLETLLGLMQHNYLRLASALHLRRRRPAPPAPADIMRAEPPLAADAGIMAADGSSAPAPAEGAEAAAAGADKRQPRFYSALEEKPEAAAGPAGKVFALPSINYLTMPKKQPQNEAAIRKTLQKNGQLLAGVLEDFGVKGDIVQAYPGPVVTLYELEPAPGVKSSRIISLADDIARSMSAASARIAVIPSRNAIGIELPNKKRETVYLREILEGPEFQASKARLTLALGQSIGGETVLADLAKMPHLLVAGTTGSGKSVAINTMILSLLYRMTPQQCRLIMVDPKMLELSVYDGIPHLLTPVVTDPKKALSALKWAVKEMEDRYRKMAKLGVRNIDGFNARVRQAQQAGNGSLSRTVQTGFDKETGEPVYETEELAPETLPYIVVIIDEMADLMMVAGKEIEGAVQRLAQMARAAGIHVIMATQRPSVDVITGTIKANFPTRISFQVTSKIDSRTILGEQGAEQLLGMGDMLYMEGGGRIKRVHGPFVGDAEVEKVVTHLKKQGAPEYLSAVMECHDEEEEAEGAEAGDGSGESDDPYDKAVDIVLRDRRASTSYIQRRLGIGYNRAASLIERMEQDGVISAANHAGKREILVPEREAV